MTIAPITSQDVAFSLALFKLPFSNNLHTSLFYERIKSIELDPENNKKFKLYCIGNKHDLIELVADVAVLQKSKFDPEGLLDHITLEQISNSAEKIRNDEKALKLHSRMVSDKYLIYKQYFSSSGPYIIKRIEQDQYVELVKNEKWWGLKVAETNGHINANPEKLLYFTIRENLSALYSLKNGDIDVLGDIPRKRICQNETRHGFSAEIPFG